MRLFRRRETPTQRVRQMLMSRSRIQDGEMSGAELRSEIDHLIDLKERNKPLLELAGMEGWKQIEEDLGTRALAKLINLPKLISDRQWDQAEVDAAYILFANEVLGLVNEPLLESARVTLLLNTKLAMEEQLNREVEERHA